MAYASPSTFGSLKTKISKKLIDAGQTAISDSDVGEALNDALRYWKQKRFWFNERTTTVTMDPNDPYILQYGNSIAAYPSAPVLPQNFLYEFPEDGFVIKYSNLSYRFDKVHTKKYDDESVNGIGIPYIYTFRNGNFEFYYLPNLAYQMTVNYVCDYPDFSASSDTNDFTQYADRILTYEALSHLSGENRQDDKAENKYAALADKEWRLMKKRTTANVGTGALSIMTIL